MRLDHLLTDIGFGDNRASGVEVVGLTLTHAKWSMEYFYSYSGLGWAWDGLHRRRNRIWRIGGDL